MRIPPSLIFVLSPLLVLYACERAESPPGARLEIAVAPLTLPGVGKICYDLRVNDGPTSTDPTVWSRGTPGLNGGTPDSSAICSSAFGNGAGGDITFVGACVASPVDAGQDYRTNSVTLWLDGVYDSSNAYLSPTGAEGWQNPCPSGCTLTAPCRESADTSVEFNLTILRQANQGFFDIGINFDDIFCSAKVDCRNDQNLPLNLLFDPSTGQRDTTVVSAFACTAGPGASVDTQLYRQPLKVSCGSPATVISLDPSVSKGNAWATDTNPADAVFQYAIYVGSEQMSCGGAPCNKRYWNVAIGLNDAVPNCTLTTRMTASAGVLAGFGTPEGTTYPYIDVNVPLTNASGLACTKHPLNGNNGVTTSYTDISTPIYFDATFEVNSMGGEFEQRVVGVTPLLDLYGAADVAYSLRKLKKTYTGPAIRVRKVSDLTETDIGFIDNDLDTAAIMSFFGGVNMLLQSERFDLSAWSKYVMHVTNPFAVYSYYGTSTLTMDSTLAPDGSNTANRLATSGPGGGYQKYLGQSVTSVAGQPYTFSGYFKKGSLTNAVRIVQLSLGAGYANFNVETGVVTKTSGATAIISDAGNGWWRCSVTVTPTTGTSIGAYVLFANNDPNANAWLSYVSPGNEDLYAWGLAINPASTPDTYAKTGSSNATQVDVVKWYDQSGNARHATSTGGVYIVNNGALVNDGSRVALWTSGNHFNLPVTFNAFVAWSQMYVGKKNSTDHNLNAIGSTLTGSTYLANIRRSIIGNAELSALTGFGTQYIVDDTTTNRLIHAVGVSSTGLTRMTRDLIEVLADTHGVGGTREFKSIFRQGNYTSTGYMSEVILWLGDKRADLPGITRNANDYWNTVQSTNFWDPNGEVQAVFNATDGYILNGVRTVNQTNIRPIMAVRRSSDNTSKLFYANASGNIDQAALLAFVGAGDGHLVAWYDQSGLNKDTSTYVATAAADQYTRQPKIVSAGSVVTDSGRQALLFNGTSNIMTFQSLPTSGSSYAGDFTIQMGFTLTAYRTGVPVGSWGNLVDVGTVLFSTLQHNPSTFQPSGFELGVNGAGKLYFAYTRSNANAYTLVTTNTDIPLNVRHSVVVTKNSTGYVIYVGGVAVQTIAETVNPKYDTTYLASPSIGARRQYAGNNMGYFMTGKVDTFNVFTRAVSASEVTTFHPNL